MESKAFSPLGGRLQIAKSFRCRGQLDAEGAGDCQRGKKVVHIVDSMEGRSNFRPLSVDLGHEPQPL